MGWEEAIILKDEIRALIPGEPPGRAGMGTQSQGFMDHLPLRSAGNRRRLPPPVPSHLFVPLVFQIKTDLPWASGDV